MPTNLDGLTPIQAAYRAHSYLHDYANHLLNQDGESDLLACVRQSADQMEAVAELLEIMEVMMGNKMPPVPPPRRLQMDA